MLPRLPLLEAPVPPVGSSAFLEYHIHLVEGGGGRREGREERRRSKSTD